MPLAQQNLPKSATLLLKKTGKYSFILCRISSLFLTQTNLGVIDEYIGKNDIYDNHFLYVQVPYPLQLSM